LLQEVVDGIVGEIVRPGGEKKVEGESGCLNIPIAESS